MIRFSKAPVFQRNLGAPLGGIADIIDSDKGSGINVTIADAYIRAASFTINHAVGTAAMSARGADWGVVDPDFHVKGLKGLRVVDASVLVSSTSDLRHYSRLLIFTRQPFITTANTMAPVYAIAERASDIIKNSY